jgi:hypothetical protein
MEACAVNAVKIVSLYPHLLDENLLGLLIC